MNSLLRNTDGKLKRKSPTSVVKGDIWSGTEIKIVDDGLDMHYDCPDGGTSMFIPKDILLDMLKNVGWIK